MNDHPDMGDQTRVSGPVQTGTVNVVGEGAEVVFLPNGSTVVQINLSCDGPNCPANKFYAQGVWYHLFVVPGRISSRAYRFCSLRCLANWLAEKLAEEETKG